MEKFMVVAGIWSMCALCAVLFIRGATMPAARRVTPEEDMRRAGADGSAR